MHGDKQNVFTSNFVVFPMNIRGMIVQDPWRNAPKTSLASRTTVGKYAVLLPAQLAVGRAVALPVKGQALPTAA